MGGGRRPLTKIELIINSSILIMISLIIMMPYIRCELFYDKTEMICEEREKKEELPDIDLSFLLPDGVDKSDIINKTDNVLIAKEKVYIYYYDNKKYEIPSEEIDRKVISHDEDKAIKIYARKDSWKLADDIEDNKELAKYMFLFAGLYIVTQLPFTLAYEADKDNEKYL